MGAILFVSRIVGLVVFQAFWYSRIGVAKNFFGFDLMTNFRKPLTLAENCRIFWRRWAYFHSLPGSARIMSTSRWLVSRANKSQKPSKYLYRFLVSVLHAPTGPLSLGWDSCGFIYSVFLIRKKQSSLAYEGIIYYLPFREFFQMASTFSYGSVWLGFCLGLYGEEAGVDLIEFFKNPISFN